MDLEGPFGWKRANAQDFQQIFDRLKSFETMTWQAIDQTKSCGFMPVEQMSKEAQDRLAETGRDEYDALYKLRITQKGRLWGVRMEQVLHLLWWDPEHRVYQMNIKDN
jgi:hypothetical protein